jgi:hypothetical protein
MEQYNDPKIEVYLDADTDPDNQDTPYFYCVLVWSDGPTLWHGENSEEPESIMPGTEKGSWYNSGISGWAVTPEEAFAEALTR